MASSAKIAPIPLLLYSMLILRILFLICSMCVGEKRKLVIPSDMGYGDRGAPPKIPGINQTYIIL